MIQSEVKEYSECEMTFNPHLVKRIQDGVVCMVVEKGHKQGRIAEAIILSGSKIGNILINWMEKDFVEFQGEVTIKTK